jgi:hypothetical protein
MAIATKLKPKITTPAKKPQALAEKSDPLTAIAAEIAQLGREGDEALATALAAGNAALHLRLELGDRLHRAKKLVKASGQKWLPWLQENCPEVSERTCQLSMRLHKNRATLEAQDDFPRLTLSEADQLLRKPKELAEPSAPPTETLDEAEADLRAAGIPIYRPDTSPEAIAEGLAAGYIVPVAESRPSAPATPQQAALPSEVKQSIPEPPKELVGDSERLYEVGSWCRVEGTVGRFVVAQMPTHPGGSVLLWSSGGKTVASPAAVIPWHEPPDPDALAQVARGWLAEMIAVLGAEQVQALVQEVAA